MRGSVRALARGIACAVVVVPAASSVPAGAAAGSSGSQGTLLVVSSGATPGPVRVALVDVASGATRGVLQGRDVSPTGAAWSPDGKWIALAKGRGVVLLAGDGHGLRRLPQLRRGHAQGSTFPGSFSWAPDSRMLAVDEAAGHRLVIRGIDGGARVIRRTGSGTLILSVSWSPDGRWIAYDRDRDVGSANGAGCCSMTLHLIRPDGSGDHTVAVMRDAAHDAPSRALWAPGAERFVFSTEARDPDDPALALVDVDSGKVTALALRGLALGWSGDGRELAVVRVASNGRPNALSLIDSSGHGRVLATDLPPSAFAGAWSPTGTKLVIAGARVRAHEITAADLELIDPAGGSPRVISQLPRGSEVESVAWRPAAGTR